MGLLWNVFAVIAGVGILISEALLIFMALAYLAQLSLGLVVVITAAVVGYLVRDWMTNRDEGWTRPNQAAGVVRRDPPVSAENPARGEAI